MLEKLNPFTQCKKYQISFWQCPSFLFVLFGLIIIGVILITYLISLLKIADPMIVSLIVLSTAAILFIIDYIVINSFERLYEANRVKTEFISIVSHQLKAPLANFKFSLENLMDKDASKIPKEQLESFNILKENIKRMADLINDLLTLSKIETKEIYIKKEKVCIGELVKKVISEFDLLVRDFNIVIKLDIEKDLPEIFTDFFWIRQIFKKILDNAICYTSKKGEIRIKIYSKDKDICFKVQDFGIGIAQEEQKFIFQKFFRSKNILRYRTQGSGLSLYISKQILRLLGGKIWFKSKPEKGSAFYFSLPKVQ